MADGNIAAMREALVWMKSRMNAAIIDGSMDCYEALDKIEAAISAPPRNCDRFRTADEVSAYWGANVHAVPLHGDAYAMRIDGREFATFLDWLFAPAEEAKSER